MRMFPEYRINYFLTRKNQSLALSDDHVYLKSDVLNKSAVPLQLKLLHHKGSNMQDQEFAVKSPLSSSFGEEPSTYKVLVYNQLTPDEVSKANIDVRKVSFWDITASLPGKTAVDAPHISIYWYGPSASEVEKGKIIHLKSTKLDSKLTEPIKSVVTAKVGGTLSEKEGGLEFKNYTMKISYASISDLARSIEKAGGVSCECTLEYEMVSKEEKSSCPFPKTKILGEKALEK